MERAKPSTLSLETQLGLLAMRFRGSDDEAERDAIAVEYERLVDRLIERGRWEEMPAFEDMLPDERMPNAYYKYWSIPRPYRRNDRKPRAG